MQTSSLTWEQNLKLTRFDFVDNNGDLNLMSEIKEAENLKYGCGIYTFIKTEWYLKKKSA